MSAEPGSARARRPVRDEEEPQSTEGRAGCIVVGGLLGIVAGVLFAFFGLPPLLHHYFGSAAVHVGDAYEGDAKSIRVESVHRVEQTGGFELLLTVRTNKTWAPTAGQFKLDMSSGPDVVALAPDADVAQSALDFQLGAERRLVLRFPSNGHEGAVPKRLILEQPAVHFDLPEPSP